MLDIIRKYFIHKFEKFEQKTSFYFHEYFFLFKKHLIDITGHGLLDIYIMHLFTTNSKLYGVLFAT